MSWLSPYDGTRKRLCRRAPEGPLRRHLAVPWPDRALDVHEVPMVAVDLETTGLAPRRDEIVSAGWVRIERGRIVLGSACRRSVAPEGELPPSAVVIHGISDDQAASGSPLEVVVRELLEALSGAVLVAHHGRLDAAFLSAACQRCYGASWAGPSIDTLTLLERRLRRGDHPIADGALRLGTARRRFGLPAYPEHDALLDAVAAAELWLAIAADIRGDAPLALKRVSTVMP